MSRVVTVLAKVGLVVVLMVVAVFILRKDSLKFVTDAWAMRKCAGQVQADSSTQR